MPQLRNLEQGTVIHHIPGRLRVRLPRLERDSRYAEDLQRAIAVLDGIKDIRVNPAASSIIITYLPQQITEQTILEQLENFGSEAFILFPGFSAPTSLEAHPESGQKAAVDEAMKEDVGEQVGSQFGEQVGELVGESIGALLGTEGASPGAELGARIGGTLGEKMGEEAVHEPATSTHHHPVDLSEEAEEIVAKLAGGGAGEVVGEVVGEVLGGILLGPAGAILGAEIGAVLGEGVGGMVGESMEHSLHEADPKHQAICAETAPEREQQAHSVGKIND